MILAMFISHAQDIPQEPSSAAMVKIGIDSHALAFHLQIREAIASGSAGSEHRGKAAITLSIKPNEQGLWTISYAGRAEMAMHDGQAPEFVPRRYISNSAIGSKSCSVSDKGVPMCP